MDQLPQDFLGEFWWLGAFLFARLVIEAPIALVSLLCVIPDVAITAVFGIAR